MTLLLALIAAFGILGLGIYIGTLIHTGNPSNERPTLMVISRRER